MISPIIWNGGTEWPVSGAPPGFESLHFGSRFSTFVEVPDGLYAVTLAFMEITVQTVGARVFDVLINDQLVISGLDLWARSGWAPLYRMALVGVRGGSMLIDFRATVRSAICSGVVIEPLQNLALKID